MMATRSIPFGDSDIRTQPSYLGATTSSSAESQRSSADVTMTAYLASRLVSGGIQQRRELREAVVSILKKTRNAESCIDVFLDICTTTGGPDGLDIAIDVLSDAGDLVLIYAWDFLQRDLLNWSPASDRAYEPNDGYWYVLLRAVARAAISEEDRLGFIACCCGAESRGIREGVVEGLRDLGTPAANYRLRQIAEGDSDAFIRHLAREAMDELENY